MEIGMSSACFYPNIDVENSIKIMKSLGFNSGELFINTLSEFEKEFSTIINEKRIENNFRINSIHGFSSFFEPLLFNEYKRRRKDMMKLFKKLCVLGNAIGAESYTFHGMRLRDKERIKTELILDIYNEIAYIANESGIKLSQENVSWCISSDIEFLNLLKEKCRYPIYFTLDIKQANKAGVDIKKYIDVMGSKMCNYHINDYDDENVCLLPGKGKVNYSKIKSYLDDINYKGMGIIEVYSDNYEKLSELTESKKILERIYDTL
ncbi:sugar phosphate isomerase/epimerase [Clostridium sediminicola]|uniref:sugar phosphate isomerase/epimerase family protein n=1 Tax=Clostridium sediminicola TaxID=3114879 RepID=UPI0031F263E6